jgi:HK97 family phage major capsid protein
MRDRRAKRYPFCMEGFTLNPRIKALQKQKDSAKAEYQQLVELAESEDRDWTDEEQAKASELKTQVETFERRIDRITELYTPTGNEKPLDTFTVDKGTTIVPQGPQLEKDPKRGFSTLGDFARNVWSASQPGARLDDRMQILSAASGMQQGLGAEGGFLVPPEFSTSIWDGLNKTPDNLLAMTDGYTVTGDSLTMNANAETSRATGSRWGGVRAYWIAEADQITSSKPTFRQVKIEPQQLAVLVYVTDKLLRNASALDQYVGRAAVEEINFLVNDAIINGTGVGQPLGILTSPCLVSVAKETGQAAASLVVKNIYKMFARCHARSRRSAVWFINQDIEPQLHTMTLDAGTAGVPVYMPPGGISGAPYGTILGRPVMPVEYAATLGTVGDIILADLSAYASGTQGGLDSAMSMHLRFDYAETAFRFMFAVDGQPWLASPITPYKGTGNTVSPFVALATRA